jgi:copper chaperone CopZ
MIRRNFLQRLAFTGGFTALGKAAANMNRVVTYRIKGFTCITCAVGLDALLRQQTGIVRSESSYPEARTTVEYNPKLISEKTLKALVAEMGFSVVNQEHH